MTIFKSGRNQTEQEVYETEKHLHNREKWFGVANVPAGETHTADRMTIANAPFALLTGNNVMGAWVQILGSSDTPVQSDMERYDGHRFMVTDTDSTVEFLIEIAAGESADLAALVAAEAMTEAPFISASNNNDSGISDVISSRIQTGQKAWARARCIGQDAKTINFYFGLHEYLR